MTHESKKLKNSKNITHKRLMVFLCVVILLSLSIFIAVPINKAVNSIFGYGKQENLANSSDLQIHFIDVGQGECIAIKFPDGKTMLIDAGTTQSQGTVKDYLCNIFFQTEPKIFDYVVLTHSDSDHCGGMEMIYDLCQVKCSIRPTEYSLVSSNEKSLYSADVVQTQSLLYGKYIDKIYTEKDSCVVYDSENISYKNYPNGYIFGKNKESSKQYKILFMANIVAETSNECCPAIYIDYDGVSIMLTGDLAGDGVDELKNDIATLGIKNITLYKASHHGSTENNCNDFELLQALNPQNVAISVGAGNGYGHPHQAFLNSLETLEINNVYRTDKNGSLMFAPNLCSSQFEVCVGIKERMPVAYAWLILYLLAIALTAFLCFRTKREKVNEKD